MTGTGEIETVIIAAIARNGVIGRDNALIWRLKSDLAHFKAATLGKPVVMGRKTFESLGRPLPGRLNIVISRNPTLALPRVVTAPSLEAGMAVARAEALRRQLREICLIGGADLYRQGLPRADRLVLTHVDASPEGDAHFPPIDRSTWTPVSRAAHAAGPGDDHAFEVVTYSRTGT